MKYTEEQLTQIIRPLPQAKYACDYPIDSLDQSLERLAKDYGGLNLTPDFQRGHVWTMAQRVAFCEAILRRAIPKSLLTIQFNCPHWNGVYRTDLPLEIQCVDGLQRLTTIKLWLAGEIKPFGLESSDLDGTPFSLKRFCNYSLRMQMHDFTRKKYLLQYYLDINSGGTVHTEADLNRVRNLMLEAL